MRPNPSMMWRFGRKRRFVEVADAAGNTLDIVLDGGLGKALELEMVDELTADCGHGDLLFVGLI